LGAGLELAREVAARSREALEVIRDYVHRTPVEASSTFTRLSGRTVYLKYENLQKTGSFKVRGALYKLYKLQGKYEGVVAASAGNHAQGVAYAGRIFGLKTVIVMPEGASISKIEATRGYGAEVVLAGRVYDETLSVAMRIAEERGYAFVHAFDDLDIMAGQGTIAHELLEQVDSIEHVIVRAASYPGWRASSTSAPPTRRSTASSQPQPPKPLQPYARGGPSTWSPSPL